MNVPSLPASLPVWEEVLVWEHRWIERHATGKPERATIYNDPSGTVLSELQTRPEAIIDKDSPAPDGRSSVSGSIGELAGSNVDLGVGISRKVRRGER